METSKTRTLIIRLGIGVGMIIFAAAAWFYAKAQGAVEFNDIIRYKSYYRYLMTAAFIELLALFIFQLKPHMNRSKIDISSSPGQPVQPETEEQKPEGH